MRSNAELKDLAWRRLWADRWFSRLFCGALLLGFCVNVVCSLVAGALGRLNVQDWADYARAVAVNRVDCTTPIPNLTLDYALLATSATVFQWFFLAIMSGIAAYGGAVILRRCTATEEQGWLKAAFGGFGQPFGMLWLFVRQVLIYVGWAVASALPLGFAVGVGMPLVSRLAPSGPLASAVAATVVGLCVLLCVGVPFYRYRYLWIVKAGHPEWGAGECLEACRALMRGRLMKSVRLDCAYWRPISLVLLLAMLCAGAAASAGAGIMPLPMGAVSAVSFCALVVASVVTGQYVAVGQALLYRELEQDAATAPQRGECVVPCP